jgi:hypothetical protein
MRNTPTKYLGRYTVAERLVIDEIGYNRLELKIAREATASPQGVQ